jgi:hypothetical protein
VPVAAPEPAPAAAAGSDIDEPSWTLAQLERLVEVHGPAHPDRVDEWRFTILSLREFADMSGRVPESFGGLLDDLFGDLVRPTR